MAQKSLHKSMFQFDHPAEPAKLFMVHTSVLIPNPMNRIALTTTVYLSMLSLYRKHHAMQ
jgi:hypothetical protein